MKCNRRTWFWNTPIVGLPGRICLSMLVIWGDWVSIRVPVLDDFCSVLL